MSGPFYLEHAKAHFVKNAVWEATPFGLCGIYAGGVAKTSHRMGTACQSIRAPFGHRVEDYYRGLCLNYRGFCLDYRGLCLDYCGFCLDYRGLCLDYRRICMDYCGLCLDYRGFCIGYAWIVSSYGDIFFA